MARRIWDRYWEVQAAGCEMFGSNCYESTYVGVILTRPLASKISLGRKELDGMLLEIADMT
jgi:hypothetical protein